MIRKGFYFSSKTEKNKGDRDFNDAFINSCFCASNTFQ